MNHRAADADTFSTLRHPWLAGEKPTTVSLPREERDFWLTSAVHALEYSAASGYSFRDRDGMEHAVIALRDDRKGGPRVWGAYDFRIEG